GAIGFTLLGPVGATLGAGFLNYASKVDDDEVGTAVKNASRTALELYNYLAGLNERYDLLIKAQDALAASYEKIKDQGNVDPETLERVEEALAQTTSKVKEANDEYDLVDAGLKVLGVLGDLTEKGVAKAIELNDQYDLTDKAKAKLAEALEKVREKV
ncbi:hypothetical protein TeGR_g5907, partial [Tetraparma gracilis]